MTTRVPKIDRDPIEAPCDRVYFRSQVRTRTPAGALHQPVIDHRSPRAEISEENMSS